ncbi:MAG: HlyD family secretion protein [Alphaproteobacteria bacterium]
MPDDGRREPTLARPADAPASPAAASPAAAGLRSRRTLRLARLAVLGAVVLVALAAVVDWGWFQYSHITETDARVAAEEIAVASRVAGWVRERPADEGRTIVRGEVLVEVDAREARLRLAEFDAGLERLTAERAQIKAQMTMVDAQTASRLAAARSRAAASRASADLARELHTLAQTDYGRVARLAQAGHAAAQRLDNEQGVLARAAERLRASEADLATAQAEVAAAQADRQQVDVLERRLDTLLHEELEMSARRDQQALDVADRTLKSPIDGVVSRTFVEAGEYVRPGQRLVLIHDPRAVWVEANIKETELRHLSPGMEVTLHVDAYPGVNFAGRVERIGQAATSEFALLPNPNPSGNFTKVTQRLPVRIAVDQQGDLLRPGMMVVVEIAIPGR